MPTTEPSAHISAASACSANVDAHLAAESIVEDIGPQVDEPDLLVVFAGGDHARELALVADVVRSALRPALVLGVSAESVLEGREEIERAPAVSALAAKLPGVELTPFRYRDLPSGEPDAPEVARAVARDRHLSDRTRGIVVLADPFSVPANRAISVLEHASASVRSPDDAPVVPVVGGMASAARAPGENTIVIDDQADAAGAVGVALHGDVAVDTIVSQGCRPIGRPVLVTECQRNVVKALAGKPALEVLQEMVESLDPEDRELLQKGLFVGVVINEYKDRFGRGDFLIRAVLGVDKDTGALAFGDFMRPGQTVQFHVRDAATASEDLGLLLDAERIGPPPDAALVFTCNGRGRQLFGRAHHDAQAIADALSRDDHTTPAAGFFAAGEIGPIGDHSFVHGHTASLALLRKR